MPLYGDRNACEAGTCGTSGANPGSIGATRERRQCPSRCGASWAWRPVGTVESGRGSVSPPLAASTLAGDKHARHISLPWRYASHSLRRDGEPGPVGGDVGHPRAKAGTLRRRICPTLSITRPLLKTTQPLDNTQVGTRSASADLLLLTAVTLWGLNYSIVKFGLSEIAPLAFPVFRFGVGGIVLLVILRLREGSIGVRREDLPLLAMVGFFGITLSQISFVFALTNTSASDTALLGATAPIVTTLLAAAVGLERMGRRHWVAVSIGLVGVVLIVVGGAAGAKLGSNVLGDGLALTNVLVSSVSVLPIRPLLRRYSAHRILAYEMLIGTAILVPFAVPGLLAQDYARVTLAGWGSLAYAVVFSGIVTNLLYFTAIGRVGPSRSAVYQYLQSFLAVLFAVILLGEQITPLQVLGGLVVVGSIVFGRSRVGRRFGSPRSARAARVA